jgi:hypothetical protein
MALKNLEKVNINHKGGGALNVNLMKELIQAEKAEPSRSVETEQGAQSSNPRQRFNLLSRQNKAAKKIMAQELRRIGLSEGAVERILHLPTRSCRLNQSSKPR